MKDNVDYLPIWKANSTPEERFMELSLIARKHPQRFEKMIVIYQEQSDGYSKTEYCANNGLDITETLGLIELGKFEVIKHCYGLIQE